MDYEKKYKEALNRAKEKRDEYKRLDGEESFVPSDIEYIFPELKDSEDEKIRKGLIQHLQELRKSHVNLMTKDTYDSWISWLENQGGQKPTTQYNYVKFREGDIVQKITGDKDIVTIAEVDTEEEEYRLTNTGFIPFKYEHLWHIVEEKPTKKQVWDYCNKISSEWWQITMDKWNTLTDEDKNKYNQFIGFNDFSDTLMNITAGALFQLIDTGKLEYEDGSLLLEKPDDTPKSLEVINVMNEKQVERKPDGKVEPKFRVGDWVWVVHNRNDHSMEIMQIYDIRDGRYYFNDNVHFSWSIKECDEKSHLWTIQDAKDGDVLVLNNEVFIYAHRKQMYSIAVAHCFVDSTGSFYLDGEFGYKEFGKTISLATKEQRDLLSQKMKEAGYEWDSEKKELNKIEQKHACGEDDKDALDEGYISFETAKLLNEKGFKQECDYATSWYAKQYYKNSCQGEWFEGEHQIIEDIDDKCNISYLSSNNIFIPAPTQQKVMKWLREVHGIHISVVMGCDVDNPQHFFFAPNICKFSDKTVAYQTPFLEKEFDTYELACEETIKYCLKNIVLDKNEVSEMLESF